MRESLRFLLGDRLVEIDARKVGDVGVDVNNILTPQFGQWA